MNEKLSSSRKRQLWGIKRYFLLSVLFLMISSLSGAYSQNCTVNANVDLSVCANENLVLIGQKNGLFQGDGTTIWTQVGGPAVTIVSPNSLTTNVTGLIGGTVLTFRLSTTCLDGSLIYDDVKYTVKPITKANAGFDMAFCPGTPAGSLAANTPGVNETGSWLVVGSNNGASYMSSTSPTSPLNVTNSKSGITLLKWTINNTNGCMSTDTVAITNRGGVFPVNAGTDKVLTNCYSSTTSTSMSATFGGSGIDGQKGTWSVISGPNIPTIVSVNSATTNVTNLIAGTYILRWTVSGPCGNGVDDIQITVPPPSSNVTSASISSGNQTFCDGRSSTVLVANNPSYVNEIGTWTQTAGPTVGVGIQDPNDPVTNITGLNGTSTYTFKYTILNTLTGCSSGSAVNIGFAQPADVNIVPTQLILPCGQTYATIPYTQSGSGSVEWSIISGPKTPTYTTIPTNFQGTSASPLTINGLTVSGTYIVRLRKVPGTGSSCITDFDEVRIIVSANPTASNSGTKQVLACNVTQTALAGNLPYAGIGTWTQVNGPNTAVFDTVTKFNAQITGLTNGLYTFRWLITGGPYCPSKQTDVSVLVALATPTQANAGPDMNACANTPLILSGNTPALNETGTWTVSPSTGVTFSNVQSSNAIINGLGVNKIYTLVWTISNACSSTRDTMIINTNNITGPIQALAGNDQCKPSGTTSVTLSGNNPSFGTGTWTQVSGTMATITSSSQYNTTVTGLTNGTYAFEWAVYSGGCLPTRDTVVVTISPATTIANAGTDIEICGNSVTLNGNTPTVGIGQWSQVVGGGGISISSETSATPLISNLSNGVYAFMWTISNNACPSTSDTVTVYVTNPPVTPLAGADITVCGYDTTSLNANDITTGVGYWMFVSGPNTPVITNVNNPKTKISGLITGTYLFKWSSYNGPFCATLSDEVTVNVVRNANAGSDQSYCDAVTTVNLTGTTASNGSWSLFSGPNSANITITSSNTATASNLIPGSYTFRYTINAFGCNTYDDVIVNLYTPPTQANAGSNQALCAKDTIQLAGNSPVFGIGTWTKLSGPSGGSFKPSANTPNAKFVGATAGTYVFIWTISNSSCSNADQVIVSNSAMPTNANAGADQLNICGENTVMSANLPATGLGIWSQISGPNNANVTSVILPNTPVTGLIPGAYTFTWSISSGSCPSKIDTVSLVVNQAPSVALAGLDQILCGVSSTTLQATTPTIGIGMWSQISGPGTVSFINALDPVTIAGNLIPGTYVLAWTNTLVSCTSEDQMIITVYGTPSVASAGSDKNICQFKSVTLNADIPVTGIGIWAQVSGPSTVILSSPNAPTTNVLGTVSGTYEFKWTVSNGTCPSTQDNVLVTITDIPTQANAGANQTLCNATSLVLNGNVSVVGNGTWSVVNGGVVDFANASDPVTGVSNLTPGTYDLMWKIQNGNCISVDTVRIVNLAAPTQANVGSDFVTCGATLFNLSGNIPVAGTGLWTKVSGPSATITNPSSPTTTVTGLTAGTYVFRWTISNGMCTPSTDEVTYINNSQLNQPVVTTNPLLNSCNGTATIEGSVPMQGATGTWNQVSGPSIATIVSPNQPQTTLSGLVSGSYVFRYTIANGGACAPKSADVTVVPTLAPTPSVVGANQTICKGLAAVTLNGNSPSIGTGNWSQISGPNTAVIVNSSLPNTQITGMISGTYVFSWTIMNGLCTPSSSSVQIVLQNCTPMAEHNFDTTYEDVPVSGNVLPNDSDPDNDTLVVTGFVVNGTVHLPGTSVTIPGIGSIIINTNGAYTFTPAPGWNGTVPAVPYTISDGNGGTASANLYIYVIPVNDLPVAVDDYNTTPENTPVSANVLPNDSDPDNDPLAVTGFIVGGVTYLPGTTATIPGIGTIVIHQDGSYTFIPVMHWNGVVPAIPYAISDGNGGTATASLHITVTPIPHLIDLGVTKMLTSPSPFVNDTIFKNDTVTFTIVLKNHSPYFTSSNITLLDVLPTGLTFVSATPSRGIYNPVNGIWAIDSLVAQDSVILTIDAKVDTSCQNDVVIVSQSHTDPNLINNSSFASVAMSNSSSGNDGGLESNGNLASLIAVRNFARHKEASEYFSDSRNMELFDVLHSKSKLAKNTQATELINFIPQSGPLGTQAFVSTPADLIGISNAMEVFSADYFLNNTERKAAILGIATSPSTVYEHTKMVCDRLNGGKLENVNVKVIEGKPFIITRIVQDNGDVDYTISFIAYKNGTQYIIDNRWDLASYNPSGNQPVLNFQVWANSEVHTQTLVETIFSKMRIQGYTLNFINDSTPEMPAVFVEKGYYQNGSLYLDIKNTNNATGLTFSGTIAKVENGVRQSFNNIIPISTIPVSQVVVPVGGVFDIGFSMTNNVQSGNDVLYFADGSWGPDYDKAGATLTSFLVEPQQNQPVQGAYNIARRATVQGTVKTYASLFRVLNVGYKPVDLTGYDQIKFVAYGLGSVDIVVSKKGITSWNNQYKATLNLTQSPVLYTVKYSDLANALGQHDFTAEDVVSVVLTKKGNNVSYQNYYIAMYDLRFESSTYGIESNEKLTSFKVYPNPFNRQTTISFNLSSASKVKISLYNLEGKQMNVLADETYSSGENFYTLDGANLNNGLYVIKLETDNSVLYNKIMLMK